MRNMPTSVFATAAVILSMAVAGALVTPLFAQNATTPASPVTLAQDSKGTPDERADQLVKQMTIAEKVGMLSGGQNQFSTKPVARLGIPAFEMSDGPNGVRNGPNGLNQGCAFPCGAALAATWNADLATAYGKAMGLEDRARGTQYQLGPGLNICRVPVNGRNFEYFGEDPFLAGVMASRWTKACSEQGSVPVIKHFAANNQEMNRNSVNAVVEERVMHEIYLPAFKKAVQEGGTVAIMCSYNRLNGSYASNNDWLQNQVLRKDWGFKGLVMSDWGASHSPDDILKGLDLEMPSGQNLNGNRFEQAVANGQMKDAELRTAIDVSIHRLLRTAAAMGWLDKGWMARDVSLPLDSPASAKTALEVAREAMVLLKNANGFLPLDRAKVKNVVVLGPNATRPIPPATATAPATAASAPAATGRGRGRGRGAVATSAPNIGGGGSGAVSPFPSHDDEGDYYKGIQKAAGDKVTVTYLAATAEQLAEGTEAFNKVKAADAVVICAGLNRNSEAEGRDRAFDLPAAQTALIAAAGKANGHTLVITNAGAAVAMKPWMESAAAIVHAYYLGQEGGLAVGEMVFGDVNPSGRLCSTFDAAWQENPAYAFYPGANVPGQNYPTEKYEEGLFYGYRGYDKAGKEPLFPFGYGLSFTTFEMANMKVEKVGGTQTGFKVGVDVKNTGSRAGADVVEVYVGEQNAPLPRPARELKGFAKVNVNPGETKHLEIVLAADAFAYWSPEKKGWVTDMANTFTVEAGHSERDLKLKQNVSLK